MKSHARTSPAKIYDRHKSVNTAIFRRMTFGRSRRARDLTRCKQSDLVGPAVRLNGQRGAIYPVLFDAYFVY